ncbi:MAG TPA: hypothetical protein PK677_13845 [Acidiphilium sp.]|uniref:hypothetical protein n=1 Tax=unclassified Acidiphilium TaxID=2617493 RepID=UPI00257C8BB0|nr:MULTISPECIES: hypothetical protein [unclassified Acidiphilium]HQT89610.1 hypothetical protein [Acidiphilium sp.]
MSDTDPAMVKTEAVSPRQPTATTRRIVAKASPSTTHPKRTRVIDPQTRPIQWAGKRNTRLGYLYTALRAELVKHIGGAPNAAQRALIDRIAMVQVRMAIMDEKMFRDGDLSEHAGREYLAWANSMSRMLQALGLDGAPAPQPTLADYLASKSPKP